MMCMAIMDIYFYSMWLGQTFFCMMRVDQVFWSNKKEKKKNYALE